MVIAVPLPFVIQGDEKQVLAFQLHQHLVAAGLSTQDCVAEGAGKPVQDGRLQQKRLHLLRLAAKHLIGQVVNDIVVAAAESVDELRGALGAIALQRQRGQLHPGSPAFGARLEGCDLLAGQVQPVNGVEEGGHLLQGETQVAAPYLRHPLAHAQARQRERRVGAGQHDQVQVRRGMLQQKGPSPPG